MRVRVIGAAVLSAVAVLAFAPSPAYAATYSAPLRTAVANLTVATEVRTGYDRNLFPHWVDADGDGCSTRSEVLDVESETSVTCSNLTGGRWFSYYDRGVVDRPGADRHRPHGAASGGVGLRRPQLDYLDPAGVRQRLRRLPHPGRSHRHSEPGQERPGPDRVDADVRQAPLPSRVGLREDPLA